MCPLLGPLASHLVPTGPNDAPKSGCAGPWHRWVDRWQLGIGCGMFGVSLFFGFKSIATWNERCGGNS